MWKFLYDSLLQALSGKPWSVFITQSKPNETFARLIKSKFQTDVYSSSAAILFALTILVLIFYYHILNRYRGTYFKLSTWLVWMGISFGLVTLTTYFMTDKILKGTFLHVSGYIIWLSLINGAYSAILYFILSYIARLKSPMGFNTPSFKS